MASSASVTSHLRFENMRTRVVVGGGERGLCGKENRGAS
jgi:hypothetical protein